MRRIALPLAAAALAATAPLALSAPGAAGITKAPVAAGDTSIGYQSHGKATKKKVKTAAALRKAKAQRRKRAKLARLSKPANLVLKGCAVDDALAGGVELDTLKGNTPMRRLLGDVDTFYAPLSDTTRVVLSEAAQMEHGEDGALGTIEDIWAGDRIIVRWRVARGTSVDALPAAMRVVNQGPHEDCVPGDTGEGLPEEGADEIPAEEPVVEEPVTEEPVAEPLTPPADGIGDHDDDDEDHDEDHDEVDEDDDEGDDEDDHHRRGRR